MSKEKDEKLKALQLTVDRLEKTYGKGSIMKLGDKPILDEVDSISTGSLGLDIALGIGGLPKGRVVEIYGPESSGKTTLAKEVYNQLKKAYPNVVLIDGDHLREIFGGSTGYTSEERLENAARRKGSVLREN